ncbi:hypothetical protein [Rhizobium leucaenae]|uniref:Uncharacterized protein n=1 Tax=Rhizobium leucaenae TaxID=29450 RepID=A0A7W6ZYG9_9HYPH|nr:hypothetical protein [Rhizobium leucaenae]MBB4571089.1 hypothetical protein [Rhizobium leucaenae]MBB6304183.1 hypothetical protein [Rhizobium leucaenae]
MLKFDQAEVAFRLRSSRQHDLATNQRTAQEQIQLLGGQKDLLTALNIAIARGFCSVSLRSIA